MALRLSAAAPELAATPAPDTVALPTQPGAAGTKLRPRRVPHWPRATCTAYSALFPRADDDRGHPPPPPGAPGPARGRPARVARRPARPRRRDGRRRRRAIELLEAEPREPVLPERRGRRLLRARRARRGRAPLPGRPPPGPRARARREQPRPAPARRRARLQPPPLPPAVRAAMRELAPRGKRVAAAARPAEGLTLSLCMIVKDEEEMLPRCLAAVRDAVDEIVIVDTGSKDRTREIALEFGAKVIDLEWTGSFTDARNVSFDAATGDWLMFLDADEVLVEGDGERLRALTRRRPGARPTTCWRPTTPATSRTAPPSPTTPCACSATAPGSASRAASTSRSPSTCPRSCPSASRSPTSAIDHYGYLGAVRDAKEKSRRNIELLERQVAEGLDSPFLASTSARSTPPPATPPRRWRSSSRLGARARRPAHRHATASCRRSPAASSRAARQRAAGGGARRAATRSCACSPASPTSSSSRRSPPPRWATTPARSPSSSAAWSGATRRARTRDEGQRHVPRDGDARRRQARGGDLDGAEELLRALPRRVPGLPRRRSSRSPAR